MRRCVRVAGALCATLSMAALPAPKAAAHSVPAVAVVPAEVASPAATSGLGITPQRNDLFGSALAAGDFNDDGIDDLAVGALGTPVHGHPFSGAVYELFGTRDRLSHDAPLLPRRFDETTPGVHGGI